MRFRSFGEMLGHWAERTGSAPALSFEEGGARRTLSYGRLAEAVEARAAELRGMGKNCLGIFTDGSLECVTELFAAASAGLQVVLLDGNAPEALLREQAAYTDIDLLWGDGELCAVLAPDLGRGAGHGAPAAGKLLFFTSGTTERAKAVVLTEQSLCASAYNGGALLPLAPEDTLLCMLPLCHVFGFVCGLLWGLSCGACVALGRGARHYADDCDFFRPTALSAVPSLLGFLLKRGALNEELKLLLVGAGDCPQALLDAAKARGVRVSFGYGLTETSSGVALSLGDDPRAMTVCPDDKISIAPDGEILIFAPACMMRGYYKRPEDTAAVLQNGALHTGDLGCIDEHGRLHITGRKKDMLVLPDGTKLFLPEAEAEIAALLGGTELALALRGESVVLALYGDARDDGEILKAIGPYQEARPRGQRVAAVARLDGPLPRTAAGKLKRWELQRRIGI